MNIHRPCLTLHDVGGLRVWQDPGLRSAHGVVVAFSERSGGVSEPPFASLNLAAHVGDDPAAIDENRTRLLQTLGLSELRTSLTTADQVHGHTLTVVDAGLKGRGAYATRSPGPIPATDALVTCTPGVPLMLCFADCVPVVLVAPGPTVAVVHAGWRGALASLPGLAARRLAEISGTGAQQVIAYVGPHIRACHYDVDDDVMSQFVNTFGTLARADSGGLDLEATVTASLTDAGVSQCSIARLGTCTAEATNRFFSFRSERGRTGRHAALACILPPA